MVPDFNTTPKVEQVVKYNKTCCKELVMNFKNKNAYRPNKLL